MRFRKIELARGLWGALVALSPGVVLTGLGADPHDRRARVVMRVLGGRQAAQAVLSGASPTAPVLALGVWVDVAHALSGVGFAVLSRRYARPALTDAAIAGGWAVLGLRDLRRGAADRGETRRSALAAATLDVVPGGRLLAEQADRVR